MIAACSSGKVVVIVGRHCVVVMILSRCVRACDDDLGESAFPYII